MHLSNFYPILISYSLYFPRQTPTVIETATVCLLSILGLWDRTVLASIALCVTLLGQLMFLKGTCDETQTILNTTSRCGQKLCSSTAFC